MNPLSRSSLRRAIASTLLALVSSTAFAGAPADLDLNEPPTFCAAFAFRAEKVAQARDRGIDKASALERNKTAAMYEALPEKLIESIFAHPDIKPSGVEAYAMWSCHANGNGVDVLPMKTVRAKMARCFARQASDPCVRTIRNRVMGLPPVPAGSNLADTPDMRAIRRIPTNKAPSLASPPGSPVRVATRLPIPESCAQPEYPEDALLKEQKGTVEMRFVIDGTGAVMQGEVVKSSGFASLDQSALAAFTSCKYRPVLVNGQPSVATFPIGWVFTLE